MSVKEYLVRGIRFVLHGTPIKNVYPKIDIVQLPNLLKGRNALITGGTSGIGYEIAKAYVLSGAKVVITGRNIERVQSARKKMEEELGISNRVYGIEMNNLKTNRFQDDIEEVERLLGRIDILVNNAGIGGGDIFTTSEEEYDEVMNTNLKANVFLSRIVARKMIEKNIKGNILNIASSSSMRPANSAYILSKWGVRSLTEGLALSLIPYGIVVNGIAPGPTATPMLGKDLKTNCLTRENNPIGRYVLPQEIANMSVILVSNMSRSIVGDIVYMTGGVGNITNTDFDYKFE